MTPSEDEETPTMGSDPYSIRMNLPKNMEKGAENESKFYNKQVQICVMWFIKLFPWTGKEQQTWYLVRTILGYQEIQLILDMK